MAGRIQGTGPGALAAEFGSNERLWSPEMQHLTSSLCQSMPFSKAALCLNLSQKRPEDMRLRARTLIHDCTRWGQSMREQLRDQARAALTAAGFDAQTGLPLEGTILPRSLTEPELPKEAVAGAERKLQKELEAYYEKHPNFTVLGPEALEAVGCPEHTVIMIIDDVSVTRQNEQRCVNGHERRKSAKTIGHTVVWLKAPEGIYTLTADNTKEGCLMALGFMLHNHLLENRVLQVFSDGAREIRTCVQEIFGFHKPLKMRLDWYHVCRRISENLSMALKCGRDNREANQEIIGSVLRELWSGDLDGAISELNAIADDHVRMRSKIDDTVRYLKERRPYLYCFAARKIDGIINSSNRVENMNNECVAMRQKRNGMSWSVRGSRALASLTLAAINDEQKKWLQGGLMRFSPVANGLQTGKGVGNHAA